MKQEKLLELSTVSALGKLPFIIPTINFFSLITVRKARPRDACRTAVSRSGR